MTLDAERQAELNQAWMDSLLHEVLNPEPHREQAHLNALFAKPEFAPNESNSGLTRKFATPVRWIPIAIAASIVVVLGSWSLFPTSSQRASAAIARGLQATPVAREYAIRVVVNSLSGADVTKTAKLYLDSSNRFVVHRWGWLGLGDVWFGNDGNNLWVVPRLGPAIIGSEKVLGGWMAKKDSTAPYLHIKTILNRMEKGYTLYMLPDADLEGVDGRVMCERVRADLKVNTKPQSTSVLPIAIELWADKETGVAHRVVLNWDREPNAFGPVQWTIDLQGFPALSENWFSPYGHTSQGQRIVNIGTESELETLPETNEQSL